MASDDIPLTTLVEWVRAGKGDFDRVAKFRWLEPSGLWLVELSTATRPYCPGRSADFEEAVRLAIANSEELT